MGANESKPGNSKNCGDALEAKPDLRLFGRITEFWFLIDKINIARIKSAEELRGLLVKELGGMEDQIVGTYLECDDQSSMVQGFVYCKDFKSAESVCVIMNLKYFGGHQIVTTCMPEPIVVNESMRKKSVHEDIQDESLNDAISASFVIQQQQRLLEEAMEKRQLEERMSRRRREQISEINVLKQEICERELLERQHEKEILEGKKKRELLEKLHTQKILEHKRRETILKQKHEQQLLEQQVKQQLFDKQMKEELLEQERKREILIQQHKQELLERRRKQELLEQQQKQKLVEQELLEQQREQEFLEQQRKHELNERQRKQQLLEQQKRLELLDRQQELRGLKKRWNRETVEQRQLPESQKQIPQQYKREIPVQQTPEQWENQIIDLRNCKEVGQQQKILRTSKKSVDSCTEKEAEFSNNHDSLAKQKSTAVTMLSSEGEPNCFAGKTKRCTLPRGKTDIEEKVVPENESLLLSPSLEGSREVAANEKVKRWLDTQSRSSSGKSRSSVSSGFSSARNDRKYLFYDSTEEQPDETRVTTDGESVNSGVANMPSNVGLAVVVSYLPDFVTGKMLYDCFKRECQGVKRAYRIKKKGCGEVIFSTQEQMEMCVEKLNKTFQFRHKIRVRPKPPKKIKQIDSENQQQPARRRRRRRRRGGRRNKLQDMNGSLENIQNSLQVSLSLENKDEGLNSASCETSSSESVHGIYNYCADKQSATASGINTNLFEGDATKSSLQATRVNSKKSPKRSTQENKNQAEKGCSLNSPKKKETPARLPSQGTPKNKKLTVNLCNVPQSTSMAELEGFVTKLCTDVEILELEQAADLVTMKLGTENDCKIVCERLDGKTFNGEEIRTTWEN